jgi:hypothetical protein
MRQDEFRVDKTRQDAAIDEIVKQFIESGQYNIAIHPHFLLESFKKLFVQSSEDYAGILGRRQSPPEAYPTPAEKEAFASDLALCAWQHFKEQRAEKFKVALIELISESFAFAESIYAERSGAGEAEIKAARPSSFDLEQNVLRHSIQRLKNLPVSDPPEPEHDADDPWSRLFEVIMSDVPLRTYDYAKARECLKDIFLEQTTSFDDPDAASSEYGAEASEFLWENIHRGFQHGLGALIWQAIRLAPQFARESRGITVSDVLRDESVPRETKESILLTKTRLLEDLSKLTRPWVDSMKLPLRGRSNMPVVHEPKNKFVAFAELCDELHPILKDAKKHWRKHKLQESGDGVRRLKKNFPQLERVPDALLRRIADQEPARAARACAAKLVFEDWGQVQSDSELHNHYRKGKALLSEEISSDT